MKLTSDFLGSVSLAIAFTLAGAGTTPAQTTVTHDPDGNRLSQAAALAGPPTIVSHPVGRLGQLGGTARFSVVAGGPGPFTYQWFAGATLLPGATSDVLVLSNLQAADFTPNPAGTPKYSCRVTNGTSNVTSSGASLFKDTNGRGLPDWWQLQHFAKLGIIPTADADNDGRTNLQEYLDSTNPNSNLDRFFQLTVHSPAGLVKVTPGATYFAPGSTATLTATSAGELQFAGWIGLPGSPNPLPLTINADTEVTAAFGALPMDAVAPAIDFSLSVADIAVQPDGIAVVVGGFDASTTFHTVARLLPDGSVDPAFNPGVTGAGYRVLIQADGKILVAGALALEGAQVDLVRLHPDGSIDSTFATLTGLLGTVRDILLQPDGKILVAAGPSAPLQRLHPDGTPDASFTVALDNAVTALARQSDGRIYIAGDFGFLNNAPSQTFARLLPNGATDPSFLSAVPDLSPVGRGRILVLPNGQVLLGGSLSSTGYGSRGLLRLHADGSLDQGFQEKFDLLFTPFSSRDVYALARQGDHPIVGGSLLGLASASQVNVLRLDGHGGLDREAFLYSSVESQVQALAVQSDGSVLVGGFFNSVGAPNFSQPRRGFTRLVSTNNLLPGTLGAAPAGPIYAANASATLSLSPQTLGAPITAVGIESSLDGIDFEPAGGAVRGAGNTWTYPVSALPPGVTYYRAAVTDALQQQRRSFAAGPFITPPVVVGASTAAGTVGIPFTYTARATGPLTAFTATGLPAWATAAYDGNLGVFTISGTPTAGGFLTVSLRPANAAGLTPTPLSLTIANRFAAWQNTNFTPVELGNPAISGPTADATGAGFPNLLRYALGVPAKRPGVTGLPTVSAPSYSGTRYLTLTYTRDRTAPDVALAVQVSGNLVPGGLGTGWNTGASFVTEVSRTDLGNGTETVVTRDNTPLAGTLHRFIRLQAMPQ